MRGEKLFPTPPRWSDTHHSLVSPVKYINKMRQRIVIIVKTKSWFILVLSLALSIFFSHFDCHQYNPQAYMTVCLGLRSRGSGISCITDPWQIRFGRGISFLGASQDANVCSLIHLFLFLQLIFLFFLESLIQCSRVFPVLKSSGALYFQARTLEP